MTTYKPGDIVLVQFPFTDLSSGKRRPALVISPVEYPSVHGDVVVLALKSQSQRQGFKLSEWEKSGLPKPTWIKPLIGTFSSKIIKRKIGSLAENDYPTIAKVLKTAIHKDFLKA